MNGARFDENMSPEMENVADEFEAMQELRAEIDAENAMEAEAEKVILMIVWTDQDGDEKTEEIEFSNETQAMNYWETIEGEFDEIGTWYATDFEIL